LIRFVLGYAVCDLNVVLLISLGCQKVDLSAFIIIYVELISHIKQLIVYDVFKIMRQVETVIHTTQRIEADVGVI
jgi:hypothetical protein